MITLYNFGPAFGLPDPSPFVMKTEVLLKMAERPYRTDTGGFRKAPKGKLPYIDDDGLKIADSTFIRWHIENKYGIDFDRGLTARERAVAWAFEKMMEDSLYWTILAERWFDDDNFQRGPANFFKGVPAPIRPFIVAMIRRQVRRNARGHGMGRHSRTEVQALGKRSLDALAAQLGEAPFLMGAQPTAVDATAFAFIAGALCPTFDTPLRSAAERHTNLKDYVGRMTKRFYPEWTEIAGCKAA